MRVRANCGRLPEKFDVGCSAQPSSILVPMADAEHVRHRMLSDDGRVLQPSSRTILMAVAFRNRHQTGSGWRLRFAAAIGLRSENATAINNKPMAVVERDRHRLWTDRHCDIHRLDRPSRRFLRKGKTPSCLPPRYFFPKR